MCQLCEQLHYAVRSLLTSLGCSVLPDPKFGNYLRDPTTPLCNAAEQSSSGWTRQSKVRSLEHTLVATSGRDGARMDPKLLYKIGNGSCRCEDDVRLLSRAGTHSGSTSSSRVRGCALWHIACRRGLPGHVKLKEGYSYRLTAPCPHK